MLLQAACREAVEQRLVSEAAIDAALHRLLMARWVARLRWMWVPWLASTWRARSRKSMPQCRVCCSACEAAAAPSHASRLAYLAGLRWATLTTGTSRATRTAASLPAWWAARSTWPWPRRQQQRCEVEWDMPVQSSLCPAAPDCCRSCWMLALCSALPSPSMHLCRVSCC